MVLMISCLNMGRVSSDENYPQVAEAYSSDGACPPCELLFSKLERTGRYGKLAQDIMVQERGEPKSGTGIMYSWALAALMHACDYLEELFGEETWHK